MTLSADQIAQSANLLVQARRGGYRLASLPEAIRPTTVDEAHATQDAVLTLTAASIGAIKVNADKGGGVFRGKVDQAFCQRSPAAFDFFDGELIGIEAEIAFHFPEGLAPSPSGYNANVFAAARASAAFDIVGSRFDDFRARTQFERIADALSSAAFVHGAAKNDWRGIDFTALPVSVSVDGSVVFEGKGGHPAIDPFAPVLAYLDTVRASGLPPGTILTTGSFCGLLPVAPGQVIRATLGEFDPIEVTLRAATPDKRSSP